MCAGLGLGRWPLLALALTGLALTGLALASAAAASMPSETELLRVPLANYDQMQFFGTVRVGSGAARQEFRVIFDTGSSDVWVPSAACRACAGFHRYRAADSTSYEPVPRAIASDPDLDYDNDDNAAEPKPMAFELQYGSGLVQGDVMRETLQLGGGSDDAVAPHRALRLPRATMGRVTAQGTEIQRFQTEGIVGLAMDPLARVSTPSLLRLLQDSAEYTLPLVFSLYLSPLPTAEPPSQLIFGGVDPELAGPGATWHRFPVIQDPHSSAYGFWALRLHQAYAGDVALLAAATADQGDDDVADTGNDDATVAIVDSGTSLILLPPAAFDAAIAAMRARIGARFRNQSRRSGGFSCRDCAHADFPPLVFAFPVADAATDIATQTFTLQGSDYVRCEHRVCTPQIDESTSDMVILGDVFLRAYYTVFDVEAKQLGFACPRGQCDGGVKPALALHTGFAQLSHIGSVYLSSSVFALLALGLLWLGLSLQSWLSARMSSGRVDSASPHASSSSAAKPADPQVGGGVGDKPKQLATLEIVCVDAPHCTRIVLQSKCRGDASSAPCRTAASTAKPQHEHATPDALAY